LLNGLPPPALTLLLASALVASFGADAQTTSSSAACRYTAADGAQCATNAGGSGGTVNADTAAELECTNDEMPKYCQKGDFMFQWVCTPVVCNIVYDYGNSSLAYYFDAECRKCVSCLVDRCPTVPVMGDSDYCYTDAVSGDCEGGAVDCGAHGTLCSCYQCDCDEGWATDWAVPGAGYCTLEVGSGGSGTGGSNTLAPSSDGGLSTTSIWIIVCAVAAAVVVVALVACCVCIFRKRQSKVKLQEMMEEFQTNALEKQERENAQARREHRRKGVHARSLESPQHGDDDDDDDDNAHTRVELREVSAGKRSLAGAASAADGGDAAAGGSAGGGGWLLQFCNEYKEVGTAAPAGASGSHSGDGSGGVTVGGGGDGGGGGVVGGGSRVVLDPLIAPPLFRRQDTATMSSNSPTASLFPMSPGAALPPPPASRSSSAAVVAATVTTTSTPAMRLVAVEGRVPQSGPELQPRVPVHARAQVSQRPAAGGGGGGGGAGGGHTAAVGPPVVLHIDASSSLAPQSSSEAAAAAPSSGCDAGPDDITPPMLARQSSA
jgi:hypothetical protein